MPILDDSAASWDLAYPPREARHPGSPMYPDWSNVDDPNVEWLQPDGSWLSGGYATRHINEAGSDFRRAKRIVFSEHPKEWQRQVEVDLSEPYSDAAVPQYMRSRRNRIVSYLTRVVGAVPGGSSFLVIGAGGNGLTYALWASGYNAWGLDNSLFIRDHPEGAVWSPERRIHADLQQNNILSVVSSASGVSQFDYVVDEHFFVNFTDAELVATRKIQGVDYRFIDEPLRFLKPGGTLLHFIQAGDEVDPAVVNAHTKPWWEALGGPPHLWMNTTES